MFPISCDRFHFLYSRVHSDQPVLEGQEIEASETNQNQTYVHD